MGWRDIAGERKDGYCQDDTTLRFRDANTMIWETHKALEEY
jgi:hypothetical protein